MKGGKGKGDVRSVNLNSVGNRIQRPRGRLYAQLSLSGQDRQKKLFDPDSWAVITIAPACSFN